jgi:hypothetical protein
MMGTAALALLYFGAAATPPIDVGGGASAQQRLAEWQDSTVGIHTILIGDGEHADAQITALAKSGAAMVQEAPYRI